MKPKQNPKNMTKKQLLNLVGDLQQYLATNIWKLSLLDDTAHGLHQDMKEGDPGWSPTIDTIQQLHKDLQATKMEAYHLRYLMYSRAYHDTTDFLRKFDVDVHEGQVGEALAHMIRQLSPDDVQGMQYKLDKGRRDDPRGVRELFAIKDMKTGKILSQRSYDKHEYELTCMDDLTAGVAQPKIFFQKNRAEYWLERITSIYDPEDILKSLKDLIKEKAADLQVVTFSQR